MNKMMSLIAVVVVAMVIVAGIALVVGGNDKDQYRSTATGRLVVYGNTDNNDYLDNDDLEALKKIVEDGNWNKAKYPFADANTDGKVDQSDVDYLQKLLNKEPSLMYYLDFHGTISSMNYPFNGKVAVTYDYGYMVCQTLGIYDKIVAANQYSINLSEGRYPGCKSLINLGDTTNDIPTAIERILKTDVTVVIGVYNTVKLQEQLKPYGIDFLTISYTNKSADGATSVSGIITTGVLLSCEEKANSFAKYYDDMTKYIEEKAEQVPPGTYVMPLNTSSYEETSVDTTGANGNMFGDVYCISHLPMTDLSKPLGSGCYTVSMEDIILADPDYIIISMWATITDVTPAAEGQKLFQDKCKYFRDTNAYKNGKIFGICYESYGTYLGLSGLTLLGSYIWPEIFDEEYGWEQLQYCFDNFTLLNEDVRDCGGIISYKMQT